MKKFIVYIVLIALAAWAVPNGYFLLNSDGTIDMVATSAILSDGAVMNGPITLVDSITFTNGWSIACTTNGLEFVAP